MRLMGLEAIYRHPNNNKPTPGHRNPYLLKGVEVSRVNQVWAADITYIPMSQGFLYLVAIMDWYSRYALAWTLANIMDVYLCIQALEQGIQVSMGGNGRYPVNILVERLWRSVKYEEVYLKAYQTGTEARNRIDVYLNFYNRERPHQALGYRAPGPDFD